MPFEAAARHDRPRLPVLPAEFPGDARHEAFGHQVVPIAFDIHPDVVLVGMHGDRQVRGDRPGRRRPDQKRGRDVLVGDPEVGRERDVDRRILPLLVLELRLGERGAVGEAPAHRLEGLVDEVLLVDAAEGAGDLGLVREGHRRVWTVPEPADAQALELLALDADVLLGVGAAGATDLDRAHVLLLGAELLVDLLLDRKAVAIPAGDVRRVEAHHRPAADDDVLEDLVQSVADVDVPVRVRRPVVEDEPGPPGGDPAALLLEPHRLPRGELDGLPPREVGLHRKVRAREVERALVVGSLAHRGRSLAQATAVGRAPEALSSCERRGR